MSFFGDYHCCHILDHKYPDSYSDSYIQFRFSPGGWYHRIYCRLLLGYHDTLRRGLYMYSGNFHCCLIMFSSQYNKAFFDLLVICKLYGKTCLLHPHVHILYVNLCFFHSLLSLLRRSWKRKNYPHHRTYCYPNHLL